MRPRLSLLVALLALAAAPVHALTLTKVSETTPFTGVTYIRYTTTSPKTNTWVIKVDLCASRVHVAATKAPSSTATPASWAGTVDAQVAVNADFYKTGPVRVYGAAVGTGLPWPVVQTGLDPSYASEWYYKDFGWIAFGPDWVQYTHTKQVKNTLSPTTGYKPTTVGAGAPPGTIALVSGFPEIVIDGAQVTCSSPTATTCFPDRSDMRARHPRTAMGLTQDQKTLILAVVDGRTTASLGMYGTELASLMKQLGAYVAFNLDGGGSSQLWISGKGTVNDADGNNTGGGLRAVANHLGIYAGTASGMPTRPGHCSTSPVCGQIPPGGGVVDNTDACFTPYGPLEYWRTEPSGYGGQLRWTNATSGTTPYNWAWWQLDVAEAGNYRVEVHATSAYALFTKVHYDVRAGGTTTKVIHNQKGQNGWKSLGDFVFAAGKGQWVAVFDDAGSTVASGQRITADAVRLVRLDPWCGDATCNGAEGCATCTSDCGACPICGDGACNGVEGCGDCPGDCGACPPSCGDASCNGAEGCGDCPADCGVCPPVCGDGACNGVEGCGDCPGDCGACPVVCGDTVCDASEGCGDCPADCGACPPVCGDGACNGVEACGDCPGDCGTCPPDDLGPLIPDAGGSEEPGDDVWSGDAGAPSGDALAAPEDAQGAPGDAQGPDGGAAADDLGPSSGDAGSADAGPSGADEGASGDVGGAGVAQVKVSTYEPDGGCSARGRGPTGWLGALLAVGWLAARRRLHDPHARFARSSRAP